MTLGLRDRSGVGGGRVGSRVGWSRVGWSGSGLHPFSFLRVVVWQGCRRCAAIREDSGNVTSPTAVTFRRSLLNLSQTLWDERVPFKNHYLNLNFTLCLTQSHRISIMWTCERKVLLSNIIKCSLTVIP